LNKELHSYSPNWIIFTTNRGGLFKEAPSQKDILSAIKKDFLKTRKNDLSNFQEPSSGTNCKN